MFSSVDFFRDKPLTNDGFFLDNTVSLFPSY